MNPLWKISHKFSKRGDIISKGLSKVFWILSCVIFANSIAAGTEIGEGTVFFHHAIGCVTHTHVKIGRNCKIFANVTMGAKWSSGERDRDTNGLPKVGNNVMIGAGAVLLGDITIGDNAVIGANAVVISDVPCNGYAIGVPAKIVLKANRGELGDGELH